MTDEGDSPRVLGAPPPQERSSSVAGVVDRPGEAITDIVFGDLAWKSGEYEGTAADVDALRRAVPGLVIYNATI